MSQTLIQLPLILPPVCTGAGDNEFIRGDETGVLAPITYKLFHNIFELFYLVVSQG